MEVVTVYLVLRKLWSCARGKRRTQTLKAMTSGWGHHDHHSLLEHIRPSHLSSHLCAAASYDDQMFFLWNSCITLHFIQVSNEILSSEGTTFSSHLSPFPLWLPIFLYLFRLSHHICICLHYYLFPPTQWTLYESRDFIFSMPYPQPLERSWHITGARCIFIERMNNEWIYEWMNRARMNEYELIIRERSLFC